MAALVNASRWSLAPACGPRRGRRHLRRPELDDADAIAEAVAASLTELVRWMPWASAAAADPAMQRRRLEDVVAHWDDGSDFSYVVTADDGAVIGGMGLHARLGPGALEIGYWLRTDYTGRGIATACAAALTNAALALGGITRVEIHCDQANQRSAAIPRRLGYRLDRVEPDEVAAPGEIGQSMIWVYPPRGPRRDPRTTRP
jgi:RimJ/RimL family protein N-acetyltransferase